MTMRLVDDKKLTKLLELADKTGCVLCPANNECKVVRSRKTDYISKRACFRELRKWLTPEEKPECQR